MFRIFLLLVFLRANFVFRTLKPQLFNLQQIPFHFHCLAVTCLLSLATGRTRLLMFFIKQPQYKNLKIMIVGNILAPTLSNCNIRNILKI